jgi:hypothetical protein
MKDRVDFQPETREKLSAPDYAGQMVAWARKKTESIVGRSNKDIYQTLDRNSVAVVGEDEAGRKVFDVQFPHVSVGSAEEVIETRRNAEKIWKKGLRNAARAGLINEGQAKEISLENGPYISFQNQAKGAFKTERRRDDQKEGKSTRTAIPLAPRAVARAAYSKGARLLAVGGVVMFANSACTVPEVVPVARPTEPAVSETVPIPTASPEAISSFNESAQKIVDEAFKGLGVHDINMVGAGILADPEGKEYALFTSILPDKNNETDLDFLLIGEVGTDNQVENIKGLVLDEEQQDSVLEFIAVSFNPDTETFVLEGPFIRTNTQTGEIEIFNNGSWRSLEGPERTINDVKQRLGHGVLAAIALPTPTAEAIESTYQLEDGVQLERMEQGQLVELFPGSEVFMSERGDVVIINKETGIQLAGQRIETKYGSYTFLMADSAYQYIIRSILDEKEINLDEEAILSRYPADWVANNEFKQEVLKVVEDLQKIRGFREGGESLGGYPNLTESPYNEELTRIISTLLALKEREISLGSVNLANYQPKPKDFVMVTMKIGNAQRLASILPEGLIDPSDPASMVIYTGADVGYPVIKTQDNVYLNAYFTSTVGKPLKDSYETVFYHVFTPYFTKFPWRFLVRDAGRVHGINVRFSYSLFWEGPFAPLFSNLDIYGHLTAFSPERSPYKPPYTVDQNWEQQNWVRFGTSEVVEIDFEKFE